MSRPTVLILTEQPPPDGRAPATGLAVRHARMAGTLAARGLRAVYAWPAAEVRAHDAGDFECVGLDGPEAVGDWIDRERPTGVVLGSLDVADSLIDRPEGRLVLDHVAPRLLEIQFEDRERRREHAGALLRVLGRCDEAWVGNARQRDLLLGWMLAAGHDCRFHLPIRVVPIAGPVAASPAPGSEADGLVLFHGGRDWPWRDADRWLAAIEAGDGAWRLEDLRESTAMAGHVAYLERLRQADVALELCDDNVERRYSQSFRMIDALCLGVPVICNDFLPMAEAIRAYDAGWIVEAPDELPGLLAAIAADPAERRRRAANALALAGERFDANRVYGDLAEPLTESPDVGGRALGTPLLQPAEEGSQQDGWRRALGDYARRWYDHRVRRPLHRWLRRRVEDRPRPSAQQGRTWIVVSRPDLFPTHHGAAVKIERTAWGLSHHVDEVLLLTDRRDGYWRYRQGRREFLRFPFRLRLIGWPRAVNLVRLMARGWPYANAFLYLPVVDRGIHARLLWLLRRHPVDVVQGEFPAYALPAVWAKRLAGTRALLVEHNVEYQRIAEQVPDLSGQAAKRMRRLEIDVANACDRVVTVSEGDRETLIDAGVRPGQVVTVPHGVDLARFDAAEPLDLRSRYGIPADHAVLVYHGIYSYPPNLEAVIELGERLLPALAERGVQARVVAIGAEPPDSAPDGVVFTGPVDDLAACLKGADLAVIPLRAGGGTRMKILDDFAAGVPVVSTAKGMEGIPVEDGVHLRVVDDPDAMADVVAGLLGSADERRRLAAAAREWVARFDWREIAGRYVRLIDGA